MPLYKIDPALFKTKFAGLKHLESFIFEATGGFNYTVVSHKAFTLPECLGWRPSATTSARVLWFDDIALLHIQDYYGSIDAAVERFDSPLYRDKKKAFRLERALARAWDEIKDKYDIDVSIKRPQPLTKANSYAANEVRGAVYTFNEPYLIRV